MLIKVVLDHEGNCRYISLAAACDAQFYTQNTIEGTSIPILDVYFIGGHHAVLKGDSALWAKKKLDSLIVNKQKDVFTPVVAVPSEPIPLSVPPTETEVNWDEPQGI